MFRRKNHRTGQHKSSLQRELIFLLSYPTMHATGFFRFQTYHGMVPFS